MPNKFIKLKNLNTPPAKLPKNFSQVQKKVQELGEGKVNPLKTPGWVVEIVQMNKDTLEARALYKDVMKNKINWKLLSDRLYTKPESEDIYETWSKKKQLKARANDELFNREFYENNKVLIIHYLNKFHTKEAGASKKFEKGFARMISYRLEENSFKEEELKEFAKSIHDNLKKLGTLPVDGNMRRDMLFIGHLRSLTRKISTVENLLSTYAKNTFWADYVKNNWGIGLFFLSLQLLFSQLAPLFAAGVFGETQDFQFAQVYVFAPICLLSQLTVSVAHFTAELIFSINSHLTSDNKKDRFYFVLVNLGAYLAFLAVAAIEALILRETFSESSTAS